MHVLRIAQDSFEDLPGYMKEAFRYNERAEQILCGNKLDLHQNRVCRHHYSAPIHLLILGYLYRSSEGVCCSAQSPIY